ncbi:MAG: hypothetical protein WDN04_26725 [Rhodospirillales bacterium]
MIKTFAVILAMLMLALVAWGVFFGSGIHLVVDGQELTGPFKGVIGAGG